MTIVEFLRARLDEDLEREPHALDCELTMTAGFSGPCTCGWAERMRREVEAKRRIVDLYEHRVESMRAYPNQGNASAMGALDEALRALALPYADHPEYDEAWRPSS